jgi:DNA-binding transcriptional regulator YiaG
MIPAKNVRLAKQVFHSDYRFCRQFGRRKRQGCGTLGEIKTLPGSSVLDATHRLSLISSNTARETARADYLARHERKSEKREPATMLELIELLEGGVRALRSSRPAATSSASAPSAPAVQAPTSPSPAAAPTTRNTAAPAANAYAQNTQATGKESSSAPNVLRNRLEETGITSSEFATIFGIPGNLLQDWFSGKSPIPMWVETSIQLLTMLTPAARRKILNRTEPNRRIVGARTHPFSRIDEL